MCITISSMALAGSQYMPHCARLSVTHKLALRCVSIVLWHPLFSETGRSPHCQLIISVSSFRSPDALHSWWTEMQNLAGYLLMMPLQELWITVNMNLISILLYHIKQHHIYCILKTIINQVWSRVIFLSSICKTKMKNYSFSWQVFLIYKTVSHKHKFWSWSCPVNLLSIPCSGLLQWIPLTFSC